MPPIFFYIMSIEIFLHALESTLGKKRDSFITRVITVNTRFSAIKKVTIEVYLVTGNSNELISKVEDSYTIEDKESKLIELEESTIVNVLNRYGLK